ncbi:MAG: 3-phosphoshikimate 1-carboxyvinyltransferase [Ruminococcaceae bacterium]|nr:3-phosphoshikimate 1-carboxyvinyltransferase [Oscillospiraceae bacterium]
MRVEIEKSTARGRVYAPPSKSMAHRLLIAAAMCDGESEIVGISSCEDVLATIDCLRTLGAKIEYEGDSVRILGIDFLSARASESLACRESGSTLRFFIPLLWLSGNEARLVGSEKLLSRPQSVYEEIAKEKSLLLEKTSNGITLRGPLASGEYRVRGDVSSQFITGLLFALSLLQDDSRIVITTALESRSYIDLTISAMAEFGVKVIWENDSTLYVEGAQKYKAGRVSVEGDYSGSAFADAFNYIGGKVDVLGLKTDSLQGDRVYKTLFPLLDGGCPEINIEDCPDLAPILFTLAAMKNGATFIGTRRLKIKESDRAEVMREELSKFGADISVMDNMVRIFPATLHTPREILFGHNDHRIVMSLAAISSVYGGVIDGCEAVKKSYPDFFSDIKKLGIKFRTYEA